MNILLVEDHKDVGELTTQLLSKRHRVTWAESGAQALNEARSSPPDVLLIDISLPDMSGHDVARELRQDPRFSGATLVALSGFSDDRTRANALDAGFDAFWVKPMDFSLLDDLRPRERRPPQ